jgi:UDP-N-acetyl-D-mannosaminuronate dehydrogenase
MLKVMPKGSSPEGRWRRDLTARLRAKDARVAVGLGYLRPMLETSGLVAARAFRLDHSPERIAGRRLRSRALTVEVFGEQDCVVVPKAHSGIDFEHVVKNSAMVFVTRGATRGSRKNVVRL